MGLKLGRLFKKAAPFIGAAGGFFLGGPGGAAAGFRAGAALRPTSRAAAFAGGGIGAGVPSIEAVTGVPSFLPPMVQPVVQANGGLAVPAAGALPAIIAGMNRITAMAIARLAAALGITFTLQSLPRVGLRLWRTMMAFARRHPGVSIIGLLASLGLAADEAAHFLSWGATRARRRRGRGISARDIRICRRTIRKMSAFRHDLAGLGAPGPPRRRRGARGDGGVSVVRAG